jgi:hypothetical protein
MVIHELLGLAKEERVRPQLVSILVEIARIAKTKQSEKPELTEI